MSQPFDLDRLLLLWKQEYGTLVKSKKWQAEYYQIPVHERFELFKKLVWQIKEAGKPEEYFSSSQRQDQIIDQCVPHKSSVSPSSLKSFVDGSRRHLIMAVLEVYKEKKEEVKKAPVEKAFTKEFDPNSIEDDEPKAEEIVDPEMAELLGYNDK